TSVNDGFDGERGSRRNEHIISGTIGVTYKFKQRGWNRVQNKSYIYRYENETDQAKGKLTQTEGDIASLEAENARLKAAPEVVSEVAEYKNNQPLPTGAVPRPVVKPSPGLSSPCIYVSGSGENATLKLSKDHRTYGAFFQFGSIIAWSTSGAPKTDFNPSDIRSERWNGSWSVGDFYPAHTAENIKAGKGDPCRLVGYTSAEIRSEVAQRRAPDNGQWRMPTKEENMAYVADRSSFRSIDGVKGRFFGAGASSGGGEFLPASGYRYPSNGDLYNQGVYGTYTSDTPEGNKAGSSLNFNNSSVSATYKYTQSRGFSVRCVRQ
ncbi:MAG: hypothetical protein ACRCZQ_01965, partial [Bacteroidales bacterium]